MVHKMETVDYFPIEVKQTSWQASSDQLTAIRYQVFVDEQNVPKQEEIDHHDLKATHWLAFGSGHTAMATARLLDNGQIGRIAVLAPYRQLGVGSSIMRHIIDFAIKQKMGKLSLSAQTHAIPFYQRFGFVAIGEPFIDSGLLHTSMQLNLDRYINHSPPPALSVITPKQRERVSIEGVDAFRDQAEALIQCARRDICIFSDRLDAVFYSNTPLCYAIHSFITQHPSARVRIIVKDITHVINHSNQLHELCLRLPSRIQIKKLQLHGTDNSTSCQHSEFILIDRVGLLYKQEPKYYVGYVIQYAPTKVVALVNEFETFWNQAQIDPELRHLNI